MFFNPGKAVKDSYFCVYLDVIELVAICSTQKQSDRCKTELSKFFNPRRITVRELNTKLIGDFLDSEIRYNDQILEETIWQYKAIVKKLGGAVE